MSLPRRSGSNDILVWHQEVTVDSDPALVAISMHPHNCEDDDDEHDDDRGAGVVLLCQVATAQDFFTGFITLRELKNIEPPQDAASGSGTATTSQNSIHDDDDDLGPKILGLPIPMQNLLRLLETACSGSAATTPSSQQQKGEQPLTLGFVKTTTTKDNTTTTTTQTVLRVSVKQRLSSGIVRTLFHTTLMRVVPKDDPQPDGNNNNNNNNNHLLQLSLRLRQRQTTLMRQLQTWQQRYTQLEQAQKEWQTTAEQLEGQWDQEKTQLLHNFCDLYTAKQNDSRRQYQELQQQMQTLQHELEQARAALSSSSSNRTSHPRGTTATVKPLPEAFQTIPGDADHERLFDPEMVSCLAAGRRVRTTAVPPNQQPSAPNTTTTRKRRFNPTLGTMEYMDVDAALEDVEGEEEDKDNTTRNTNPTTTANDPSTSSPQPAPPATKKAKSNKATARSSKQNNNNNSNNQDDDSSTASDNSLFDAKMHGDILSQLAKL